MKHTIMYIVLLGILESILFFQNVLGLNVILFVIPLCIFLYYYLKNNNLIKNKKGFYFLIPILLLSTTYSIYENDFSYLNILAIPAFFLMMILFIVNPKKELEDFFEGMVKNAFQPIVFIDNFSKSIGSYSKELFHLSDKQKQIVKSIFITIPIVVVVLLLLSSADKMFSNLFSFLPNLWNDNSFSHLVGRVVRFVFFFFYVGASTIYWKEGLAKDENKAKKIKISEITITLLLSILNIIYVVFDIIQIRSLWLHNVSSGINYAEYARSGFFQLMFISVINLVIIILSKKAKETKHTKWLSTAMIGLTIIIIFSSFFRMYLYEQAYGYTVLRLGVYTILATELILLIPTIIYIYNSKLNLLKYYIIIVTVVYCIINCVSVDQIIAKNNIHRYDRTGKIDINYLTNEYADNMELLLDFYDRCDDVEVKDKLNNYFERMKIEYKNDNILEYNYSKAKAKELLEKRD